VVAIYGQTMSGRRTSEGDGLFHASVSLGRIAGVRVGVNWSWLLILVLLTLSLAAAVFPTGNPGLSDWTYAAMAGVATVLFFVCLLLHEIGHAVQARREGMEIEGITLWLFGGVARFKGMFPSAGAEFRIAIAGPLVSLALGIAFLALAQLPLPSAVDGVVGWLGSINLLLLAFNMVPALPLDGGRVLRSLLWKRSGDFTSATRIAGGLGRAFGQVMIAGGTLLFIVGFPGGLWFAFIGWFLMLSAAAEANLAETQAMLAGLTVQDAMVTDPVVAPADASLDEFVAVVFAAGRHTAYPVTDEGAPVGTVAFRDVAAVPQSEWSRLRVRDVMTSLEDSLVFQPAEPLFAAAVALMQSRTGRAIVAAEGRLAGWLCIGDISRLLELLRITRDRDVATVERRLHSSPTGR
jgi:Zn-dependent protease/CBS domain-containing protein